MERRKRFKRYTKMPNDLKEISKRRFYVEQIPSDVLRILVFVECDAFRLFLLEFVTDFCHSAGIFQDRFSEDAECDGTAKLSGIKRGTSVMLEHKHTAFD